VFILAFIVVNVASSSANGGRGHASANTRHPHRIKSQHQLIKLLRTHHPRYYAGFRTGLTILRNVSAIPTAEGGDAASSSTLLQVAGVDEGDVVKNDAAYIYQINQGRVLVVHAFPDSNLGVVNTLDFSDDSFYPQELYLDGQHLVVVGSGFTTPDSSSAPDAT
jgi:uncharacterized secreted protein with C-terminal beta-propeller domain